jgi:hypothetical protein
MELKIAESPFFNALYAVALPKKAGATGGFVAGDKVEITVDAYPYTSLMNSLSVRRQVEY